jgi:RecA-family ATPase
LNELLDLKRPLGEIEAAQDRKRIVNGYEIYRSEYPAPTFLFQRLLPNGLTILAGRPKSGKSWLTLQMAVCAALSTPFLDRFEIESAARVLYFGLEEGQQRTNLRLRKLLPENDVRLQNIGFLYQLRPLAQGGADELNEHLTRCPCELVVIDTFLAIANATSKRDVMRGEYAEVNVLRKLAEQHKNAFVLVHHTRKMGADTGLDMVAGTTGITAACDAVMTLRKQPTGDSILEMTGREIEESTLALRLDTGDPFGWKLIGEGAEVAMSEQRLEIFELLKEDAPLKPAEVARRLKKNEVTVRRLIQKMAANGDIMKGRDGKYFLAPTRS